MPRETSFPRALTSQEKNLLMWILPSDRPGYRQYRSLIGSWTVAARGRRGEGNFILTPSDTAVDNESPLPQIHAYGVVRTSDGDIAVSVREQLGDQIEFEIVNLRGASVPEVMRETSRWTFSTWLAGQPCPICLGPVREVAFQTTKGRKFVTAFCARDERIWLYDGTTGVNHPIPLTNFYNELMLHTNTRDPKIALDAKRLFTNLRVYSDADLARAFESSNKLKAKVLLDESIEIPTDTKPALWKRLRARIIGS